MDSTVKVNQPNAEQKRWREIVRQQGSVITGRDAVIHHAVGRTAKHNKVKIGHWWLLPLADDEHKDLHNGATFGYESRKEFEKAEFSLLCQRLEGLESMPDLLIRNTIANYHR